MNSLPISKFELQPFPPGIKWNRLAYPGKFSRQHLQNFNSGVQSHGLIPDLAHSWSGGTLRTYLLNCGVNLSTLERVPLNQAVWKFAQIGNSLRLRCGVVTHHRLFISPLNWDKSDGEPKMNEAHWFAEESASRLCMIMLNILPPCFSL